MRKGWMRAIVTGALVMAAMPAAAQAVPVAGVVVEDRTDRPLPNALVYVEGQPAFAETGPDGRFILPLPPGTYSMVVSLIGYAMTRQSLTVVPGATVSVTIRLPEGAGTYTERVTVTGAARPEAEAAPAGTALYGRELQELRGLMLDDPLRAAQAAPSATATDDFYSEFAVRGSSFRHIGLSIDGVPSRYLMHTIHGVSDGGSIAMVNSETLGAVSLLPGSYPQRTGRRLGAHLELTSRDGNREAFRGRVGLSGTSAAFLGEGPLNGGRGSWLVSVRRSYLDLLIKQIDADATFAFGFTDAQANVVYDLTPRHKLRALTVLGRSDFEEGEEDLAANDEAHANGVTWLSALTWQYVQGPRFAMSQRVYMTGVDFTNWSASDIRLDSGRHTDAGWRMDASVVPAKGWAFEFGGEWQRLSGRQERQRTFDGATMPTTLSSYDVRSRAAAAYGLVNVSVLPRVTVSPGARVDYWRLTEEVTTSPWLSATLRLGASTRVLAGAGVYRQFPEIDQVYGTRAGGVGLRPERAVHTDVAVEQTLGHGTALKVTLYQRAEEDVLWTPGAEPRRESDGAIRFGRGDAPWVNALEGRARGVELLIRRSAPEGLSGWAAYAFSRHRYSDDARGEAFWADADQRHTVSLYGRYPFSHRTSLGAKFRYGSNYPLLGYLREQPAAPNAPPLFGGGQPLFYGIGDARNTLRLSSYSRLDVRADRAFDWSGRRLTLFVEVANLLNHRNVRNTDYAFDRSGRVFGATDELMPIVPSAGFVLEF